MTGYFLFSQVYLSYFTCCIVEFSSQYAWFIFSLLWLSPSSNTITVSRFQKTLCICWKFACRLWEYTRNYTQQLHTGRHARTHTRTPIILNILIYYIETIYKYLTVREKRQKRAAFNILCDSQRETATIVVRKKKILLRCRFYQTN